MVHHAIAAEVLVLALLAAPGHTRAADDRLAQTCTELERTESPAREHAGTSARMADLFDRIPLCSPIFDQDLEERYQGYTEAESDRLIEIARIVQSIDLDVVEGGIRQYCSESYRSAWERIYILNQVVFHVTSTIGANITWQSGRPQLVLRKGFAAKIRDHPADQFRSFRYKYKLRTLPGISSPAGWYDDTFTGPRLVLDSREWDVGRLRPQQWVQKALTVYNVGSDPLELSCEPSEWLSYERNFHLAVRRIDGAGAIPPGGRTRLLLRYCGLGPGPVETAVTLETSDPAQQRVTIRIRGTVEGPASEPSLPAGDDPRIRLHQVYGAGPGPRH